MGVGEWGWGREGLTNTYIQHNNIRNHLAEQNLTIYSTCLPEPLISKHNLTLSEKQSLSDDKNSLFAYHGPGRILLTFLRSNALGMSFKRAVTRFISARSNAILNVDGRM